MQKRKQTSIYLPEEIQVRLDEYTSKYHINKSNFLTKVMIEYFERIDAQKAVYRNSQDVRNALIEASYNVG